MASDNDARGYGKRHRQLRTYYRPLVEAGEMPCGRCLSLIIPPGGVCPKCGKEVAKGRPGPGQCGWDLGHDDVDREIYTGPEHSCCNRSAGAKKAARRASARTHVWSRRWLMD